MQLLSQYIFRHKGMLLGAFGFGLFSYALSIAIPLCIGKFYALAFDGGSARAGYFDAVFGPVTEMPAFFMLFFSIVLSRFLLQWGARYCTSGLTEYIAADMREDVFTAYMTAPISAREQSASKKLARFSGDIANIQRLIGKGFIGSITDIVFIILVTGVFFLLDTRIGLYMLIAVPLFIGITILSQRVMTPAYAAIRRVRSRNLTFVSERLYALPTIKLLNRIQPESKKYHKRTQAQLSTGLRYQRWNSFHTALYPMIAYILLGGMMAVAFWESGAAGSQTDAGTLIVCIMLAIQISPVIKSLMRSGNIRRQGFATWKKMEEVLTRESEWLEKQHIAVTEGNIQIDKLHFRYDGQLIFHDLNCEIPGNSITLITGAKGSGKSTLFKLLAGMYRISSGHIFMDQHNFKNLSAFTVRKQVALISPEMPLVGRTVFEAVSYSRDASRRKKVLAMLADLGFCDADDNAALDKRLQEGGKNLSSGERQLLRIARGLLTYKKVILMDEPFQGLDPQTIERVQAKINALSAQHTIAIITADHRAGLAIGHHIHLDHQQLLYA